MKKFMITAIAVSLVCILAMPAMAIEFEVEGHWYTEGVYNEHPDLRDNRANDYLAMELRLQPEFTFSENVKLITRFDALGRKWGNSDNSQISSTTVAFYNAAGAVTGYHTATSFDDDDDGDDGRLRGLARIRETTTTILMLVLMTRTTMQQRWYGYGASRSASREQTHGGTQRCIQ